MHAEENQSNPRKSGYVSRCIPISQRINKCGVRQRRSNSQMQIASTKMASIWG